MSNTLGGISQLITSLRHSRPDVDFITESLAIGGALRGSHDLRALASLGIGSVMDLRVESTDDAVELERLGMRFLHLPTPDRRAFSQEDLETGTAWVLDQMADDRKVLVHCRYGIGRSVILAAAVLARMGYDWREAMRLIQRKRPHAAPRDEEVAALAEFARTLKP